MPPPMDAPDGWLIPLVLKILSPSSTPRHPTRDIWPAPPMDAPDGRLIRAGGTGPDAEVAGRWDAWRAALQKLWSSHASAALAERALATLFARGPEDEADPSRPAAPALPPEAWALIMDRAESCRYGRAGAGWLPPLCPVPSYCRDVVLARVRSLSSSPQIGEGRKGAVPPPPPPPGALSFPLYSQAARPLANTYLGPENSALPFNLLDSFV